MLYLVDGYNVTMQDPATAHLSKERQREALLHRLRTRIGLLSGASRVVVVFDAREQFGTTAEKTGSVEAVFAPDADDEIVRRCARVGGRVCVVTGDLRLRARISQDVSRSVECMDRERVFEGAVVPVKRPRRTRAEALGEGDVPRDAGDITRELQREWGVEDE